MGPVAAECGTRHSLFGPLLKTTGNANCCSKIEFQVSIVFKFNNWNTFCCHSLTLINHCVYLLSICMKLCVLEVYKNICLDKVKTLDCKGHTLGTTSLLHCKWHLWRLSDQIQFFLCLILYLVGQLVLFPSSQCVSYKNKGTLSYEQYRLLLGDDCPAVKQLIKV